MYKHYIYSLIENMLWISKESNVTQYHPFLDSYPLYQNLKSQQKYSTFNNINITDTTFSNTMSEGEYLK